MKTSPKIAFVVPWFGESIPGGAEAATRAILARLRDRGISVSVLTTCIRQFSDDWDVNGHTPGTYQECGVEVLRFPVEKVDREAFDRLNHRLLGGGGISAEEENVFLEEMIRCPALKQYIGEHSGQYDLLLAMPYMFTPVVECARICPEKTVLIPCLHDEAYAHLSVYREAFSRVRGMIFLSEPESRTAEALFGAGGSLCRVIGLGVDTDQSGDGQRFREKYGIHGPFLLYAGRKAAGKKVDELVRNFLYYKHRNSSDLKLVLLGGGEVPLYDCADILDLGFVSVQDKWDAYAAARAFVNPSEAESFSIVIMESWLAGTPVLVNEQCPVTTDFVRRSRGGLYYSGYLDFEGAVNYLIAHEKTACAMGRSGRAFVLDHFRWEYVTGKYLAYLDDCLG